jgi:hypothetical protein
MDKKERIRIQAMLENPSFKKDAEVMIPYGLLLMMKGHYLKLLRSLGSDAVLGQAEGWSEIDRLNEIERKYLLNSISIDELELACNHWNLFGNEPEAIKIVERGVRIREFINSGILKNPCEWELWLAFCCMDKIADLLRKYPHLSSCMGKSVDDAHAMFLSWEGFIELKSKLQQFNVLIAPPQWTEPFPDADWRCGKIERFRNKTSLAPEFYKLRYKGHWPLKRIAQKFFPDLHWNSGIMRVERQIERYCEIAGINRPEKATKEQLFDEHWKHCAECNRGRYCGEAKRIIDGYSRETTFTDLLAWVGKNIPQEDQKDDFGFIDNIVEQDWSRNFFSKNDFESSEDRLEVNEALDGTGLCFDEVFPLLGNLGVSLLMKICRSRGKESHLQWLILETVR